MSKRKLAIVVVVIAAASIAATGIAHALSQTGTHQHGQMGKMNMGHAATAEPVTQVWTCSMHPQVKLAKKGSCPICGMNLISTPTSKMGVGTAKSAASLEKLHAQHLPIVMASVKRAAEAVESGNKKIALVELRKAQMVLAIIHRDLGTYVKPKFANNRCPIMNSPINSAKVTSNLTRDYKGQKIAFCCAGCPAAWDKLSDFQKQSKLTKVKLSPMQMHSGDKH